MFTSRVSNLYLLVGCLALVAVPRLNSARAEISSGQQIYKVQCARCHGEHGEGTDDFYPEPLLGDRSVPQLAAVIEKTMPEDTDAKCSAADAQAVAAFVFGAFYSADAQTRNKPARVELSRLTVGQYRNVVTDLVGSFRGNSTWGSERGLRAEYFASRKMRKEDRKIERVDSQVQFDFGEASPDSEKIEAHEFSIRWEGSIFSPDSGDYEFVVHTEHACRLWVNDRQQPLIDAWVKSGSDTEYRANLHLLGGRAYPLKLEFSKAKQGVDDSNKDKGKPKPPVKASVVLSWVRPLHTVEPVASRYLSTSSANEVFVLSTPFPPDDRSTGFERGNTISKAWDQATTDAAIEVAGYVTDKLPQLAGASAEAADQEPKLRDFCRRFVERAFRRPLTDEQKQIYIDRQFEKSPDRLTAVKRVLLLSLKSPRFLYSSFQPRPTDAYDTATRLALGMWDSFPDDKLLEAAANNQLGTRDQLLQQAQRMSTDPRAINKLRGFLLLWLKVSQPADLSKDPNTFPDFKPELISDLRTSLELAIDDLLMQDSADYRQLLLSNATFFNGRLARFYGVDMPENADFQRLAFQADRRAGVLSHPYLLAGLAYTNSSSPIHRGVFLSRNLLGRTLRPPPDAVVPLAPDLHAELTTRERVALQTKAEACQTCHSMINPLGFTLEQFDAVGRFREVEKNRPIDAMGSYLTRTGETAQFSGARELSNFLANSEESRQALVRQLFQYAVKQPIQAYGPHRLSEITTLFMQNECNLRKLQMEIVVSSALPSEN